MAGYRTSDNGINHIMQFEQSRLKAYDDGKGNWTIGYGHTGKVNGIPIHKGMTITKEQERTLLQQDIAKFEKAINSRLKTKISQNQFDALVSFAFNVGNANSIIDLINKGEMQKAGELMLQYNKATDRRTGKKEFVQGLANRRESEVKLFFGEAGEQLEFSKPTSTDGYIDVPILPQPELSPFDTETANAFSVGQGNISPEPQALELTSWQNELDFSPVQTGDISPQPDYSEPLAQAFGVAPKGANNGLGDYVSSLVESIYNEAE